LTKITNTFIKNFLETLQTFFTPMQFTRKRW